MLTSSTHIASLRQWTFELVLLLILLSPTMYWKGGLLTWLPLLHVTLDGERYGIGVLAGLLALLASGNLFSWVRRWRERPFSWGSAIVTLPLAGFTALILVNRDVSDVTKTIHDVTNLSLLWYAYLFVLNERPRVGRPLALAVLFLGGISLAQFLKQGSIGLTALGELPLDPEVSGVTVMVAQGRRWLRAYGLSRHPNMQAGMFALSLLFLLPLVWRRLRRRHLALVAAVALGLAGLLVTFSRGAWLAFFIGFSFWVGGVLRRQVDIPATKRRAMLRSGLILGALFVMISVPFMVVSSRLITSRLFLNTPIEAASVGERVRSARVALQLFVQHPWWGVGSGNFQAAGGLLSTYVHMVHVAPLRAAAELGLPGLVFWGWLALAPFFVNNGHGDQSPGESQLHASGSLHKGLWAAILVLSTFHSAARITGGLWIALFYGLVLGRADP